MEKFDIHILGCGSALPTTRHFPSAQIVDFRDKLFMIDCGEAAQLQMRKSHLKFTRLNHIFISHLHGDHCFGILGLISTFNLLGRTADLHLYAPAPFQRLIEPQLSFFCPQLGFRIVIHEIDTEQSLQIYEDRSLTVTTIPLKHRVSCCGFLFREKPSLPHIIREKIDFYKVPSYAIAGIKNGADWITDDGQVIPNHVFVRPAEQPRSYAYCSDTIYLPELKDVLAGVNLLYHEATFAGADLPRARETFHTTASQAATLAAASGVGRLCIGHFSARYEDETLLLQQAKAVFEQTVLAREGLILRL